MTTERNTTGDPMAELAKAAAAKTKSGKGSIRLALSKDLEYLREAMRLGLTLSETVDQLEANKSLKISAAGLRKILLELLPTEYAEYLTNTGRGYRRTRAGVSLAKPEREPKQQPLPSNTSSTTTSTDSSTKKPEPAKTSGGVSDVDRQSLLDAAKPRTFDLKHRK